MESIEKRLHELAIKAIKHDSVNLIDYVINLNIEYYKDNIQKLLELYTEAIKNLSFNSAGYLQNILRDKNMIRELK